MYANRIRNWQSAPQPASVAPAPIKTLLPPVGFVIVPSMPAGSSIAWQVQIYRAAYERARAVTTVPRHHRRLAVWN